VTKIIVAFASVLAFSSPSHGKAVPVKPSFPSLQTRALAISEVAPCLRTEGRPKRLPVYDKATGEMLNEKELRQRC